MKNVIFITRSLSQPRIIRRIETIAEYRFNVTVYGYDNGLYQNNTLSRKITINRLGSVSNGKGYFSKFCTYYKNIRNIINPLVGKDGIVYAFDMINALILAIQKVPFIYEISDIQYAYSRFNIIKPLLKIIDKWIIRKSELTIMTSSGFCKWLKCDDRTNVIILPNKLNKYFISKRPRKSHEYDTSHLVFGFVGAPRSINTVGKFAKIIGLRYPQHKFIFWGESAHSQDFHKLLNNFENVEFRGSFKNPEDLDSIYAQIDIVVSCYDALELNERILDANKLYESIFFCRPVIMSANTFSAEQVKKHKCGFVLDPSKEEYIIRFIENIHNDDLIEISNNEKSLPDSFAIDDESILIDYIGKYFNEHRIDNK